MYVYVRIYLYVHMYIRGLPLVAQLVKNPPAMQARAFKTMLSSSGESGHPFLVPDFRGNAFSFSPLRIMFAMDSIF